MSLKERITQEMKDAMRAGEKLRLSSIRMLLAAIKQREVDERISLDDSHVLAIVEKMIKQRREAITQFEAGARTDLSEKEAAEIILLQAYLPKQLTAAEIDAIVANAITETGAATVKDMGKVMALVKTHAAGRADMGIVSALIKDKLHNPTGG
ncbi:MAG: GatB/YqeY domain-containing protein [Gammaproteobacteria bacterium]|nr:GatB/YqeY domain-containing protein [Gammaproteobacteria bacterium]